MMDFRGAARGAAGGVKAARADLADLLVGAQAPVDRDGRDDATLAATCLVAAADAALFEDRAAPQPSARRGGPRTPRRRRRRPSPRRAGRTPSFTRVSGPTTSRAAPRTGRPTASRLRDTRRRAERGSARRCASSGRGVRGRALCILGRARPIKERRRV